MGNTLQAGFSRINITPMMGIDIQGYFKTRLADGVLDELEINALALACGDSRVVFICLDNCGVAQNLTVKFKERVSEVTGLAMNQIYIGATHTHTGPSLRMPAASALEEEYCQSVYRKIGDAAQFALEDMKPARMGYGVGQAPNIAFVRRFRMKDGSVKTNPGVDNPDILAPIGDVDERVNVLRFDREDDDSLILVNFGCHPDVVGGCKISADWPGFVRRTVEKTLDNTKCIFFNGTQGDVNHVNVHPRGGHLNDMFMDFDDVARGYEHSRYMGRVVTGGVLQAFDKVKYVDVDSLKCIEKTIRIPANRPDSKDLPEARRIDALHKAGRDDEIPYKGMMLTTVVAEAERILRLEYGPDEFSMNLLGVAVGPVVMIGIPGEPFNGIGRNLKETDAFEMVLPTCCTNGYEGYFPMKDAYDEGGYEARSSQFKAGVAELILEEGRRLINELAEKA